MQGRQSLIGEKVTWWSQSGSYRRRKTGFILGIIPIGADAMKMAEGLVSDITPGRIQFGRYNQVSERYLIQVPRTGKKGQTLVPYLYAPHVSVIHKCLKPKVITNAVITEVALIPEEWLVDPNTKIIDIKKEGSA